MTTPHAPKQLYLESLAARAPELAFAQRGDMPAAVWQSTLRARLAVRLGLNPAPAAPEARMLEETDCGDHLRQRWLLRTEAAFWLPLYLLLPKGAASPAPAVVAVHGHGPGKVHTAGVPGAPQAEAAAADELDYGLQAVRRGYVALCQDMRGFGECVDEDHRGFSHGSSCTYSAGRSAMLGRTLLGERVWDVRRAIDWLAARPEVDGGRIACVGHSGGGTVTLLAAALDERIRAAVVSGYLCAWRSSLFGVPHCPCNFVPGLALDADCGDVGGLIAPRPLLATSGARDPIFPLAGVREAFATVSAAYTALGAADRAQLFVGQGEHRFFGEPVWSFLARWLDR
ncbi:MAG TPA: alpha/beta hydrolase family protein [Roseiflexaceae bacterium]|nr:alpha/beta hydrolase family protein [Roseiflexaceae bacterium]